MLITVVALLRSSKHLRQDSKSMPCPRRSLSSTFRAPCQQTTSSYASPLTVGWSLEGHLKLWSRHWWTTLAKCLPVNYPQEWKIELSGMSTTGHAFNRLKDRYIDILWLTRVYNKYGLFQKLVYEGPLDSLGQCWRTLFFFSQKQQLNIFECSIQNFFLIIGSAIIIIYLPFFSFHHLRSQFSI